MIQRHLPVDNPPERILYPLAAIPTKYAGCRFRSRLEARWAVFFDEMGIGWQYEPQGFTIGARPYLPDFLLECGTWVEVKGAEEELDHQLMRNAARTLPLMPATKERGPRLLILGPTAVQYMNTPGDYGWLGIDLDGRGDELLFGSYGFGRFFRHCRPWRLGDRTGDGPWLRPAFLEWEYGCIEAYEAANGARFEHGESGAA